ncbi:MAG: sigma-54-dependent Fis family transcriptional regulator [Deltaproteobacteria bacterium]|nr:sigma-54-dependent Fis family transcriptional regulator [Deltaproteobacteria bacterium]MBI2179478.1 sigma-54-dependent Fis family transcriptional regulator [Deltaproteobacteria bacterium]MBI2227946.1 sigma-54-dependent Fis family transcriptional regulator [Deltaproteobacteria bacterium]MBI2363827.1 sigma-54-dependent Fis family transcriptional regulator [Deltaproteobacteria bacterium]MBI2532326.1 sigma-54-dependent Fis family transcriptional regulator [Deltaproteobacteria bacterium]
MAERFRILVVDDEATQRELVCGYLEKQGFEVAAAPSVERALELFRQEPVELILTDQRMPNLSGLDLLRAAQAINPETNVIVMTAYGNIETAVAAMKAGAADYLTKPLHLEELLQKIQRIRERCRLYEENRELREELKERHRIEGVIGESGQMLEVISLVQRVAPSEATVLIRGESGTGKELIAKAIHYASPRTARPLVRVNCAALPENLLESELFGHEKGAFTGAIAARKGRFELADGGTLFLDEIGDLPPHLQAKLLRVLQEREFERVGSSQTVKVNVRILSATHRDLDALLRSGQFREDLYYRLNVVTILLPPLRERRQDLAALMDHFLRLFAAKNGKTIRGFSQEARQSLLRYDYPGNVRELENLIERAVVLSRGDVIGGGDLPLTLEASEEKSGHETQLTAAVEGLERRMIKEALARADGIQTRAAEFLGITERALRYKLKKYGLQGADSEPSANPQES